MDAVGSASAISLMSEQKVTALYLCSWREQRDREEKEKS